jgi:glycosyltransferase involved in cell wall biosynthesis
MLLKVLSPDAPATGNSAHSRPDTPDTRRYRPASDTFRVLQLGPALEVRGGVSSVERLIVDGLGGRLPFRHVPTMVERSGLARLRVYLTSVLETWRALRAPGPLLVHVHFASRGSTLRKMLLARMVSRSGHTLVMHAHGAEFDRFFPGLPAFARGWVARTLQRADACLVLSQRWKEFYVERCGVPPAKARILPNPVRVPQSLPDRRGRAYVQFLFLGRIGPRKGAFDLVRAFAALPSETRARARLVIAGDGEVEALRALAAPIGESVTIHSWVDESQRDRLLRESDVFVLPSYAEGLPMAVLESMAYALPVVTTPVGGIPDVVTDGVEGLVVQPGDVAAIGQALTRMVDDPSARERFASAARRRAESLDVGLYIEQLLQLYRTLVADDRRRR